MHSKFLNYDNVEDNNSDSTNLHGPNSQAYDSHSSPSSEPSPYHDTDSVTDNSKKIRKKRNTYQKIDDVTRMHLLDAVQQGETLKAAAKRYNINYSSAKSILHTYRKEGRILKKSAQERTSRRRVSKETSSDMEMSPIYLSKDCQEDFSANDESTIYESPESQHRSPPVYKYAQEEKPKSCFNNGVTINTFGGFLKIGVQQKSEEIAPKPAATASTVVFKLDANSVNKSVSSTNGVQKGNWQLNFNVRNEQKPVEIPQVKPANVLAISEKLKSFESFYMNYANSPLSRAIQIKKQDSQIDFAIPQDFNAFTDMITCNEDPFDVSCFLNASSPKLGRQQRSTLDFDPFAGGENFSWMDNWRGEGQEFFCDEPNKGLKGY